MVRHYDGFSRAPTQSLRYLAVGRELTNFTYDIENDRELAEAIGGLLDVDSAAVEVYIREIRRDAVLESAVSAASAQRKDRDSTMPFGRRMGWYAITRIRKPRVVFETGVHDGLGSIALLRALERNRAEGHSGRMVGFDIDPESGWLIPHSLQVGYDLILGDSLERLPEELSGLTVDLFIHDSDHRYDHEASEWMTALSHLTAGSVLISDNAHSCSAFEDFCDANGFAAHLWREVPRDHFYPGAGIGMALVPMGWEVPS